MKLSRIALIGILVAGTLASQPARAAVDFNEIVPVSIVAFVPCAADGMGEVVLLEGPLHILFSVTLDGKGGFHAKSHFQPAGISGFGVVTGDKYQATGVTQDHFNGKVGETTTFVNNYRIIGQGKGNNLLVHEVLHVTVNANGSVVVVKVSSSVECK